LALEYKYVCPKCGAPTNYSSERQGLCIECYLKKHRAKIDRDIKIKIDVCIGCGRVRYGKDWFLPSFENLATIIKKQLKKTVLRPYDIQIEDMDRRTLTELRDLKKIFIPIKISVTNRDTIIRHVEIDINKAFCSICSKKQSGRYYESVIHLRFQKEMQDNLIDVINRFVEEKLYRSETLEIIDVKKEGGKGVVVRLSSKKLARNFLGYLGQSFSLIILKRYTEPIILESGSHGKKQISVEKYIIRLMR